MENKYFIFTGMGRTATQWLAETLNKHPMANVTHEPFSLANWPDRFTEWLQIDSPIVGMANSFARFYIKEIEDTIHPDWHFLWRDPYSLINSNIARHNFPPKFTIESRIRYIAPRTFGDLESALACVERLKISVIHWHYDYYTTKEGFTELAHSIGLDFNHINIDFKNKINAAGQTKRHSGTRKNRLIHLLKLIVRLKKWVKV